MSFCCVWVLALLMAFVVCCCVVPGLGVLLGTLNGWPELLLARTLTPWLLPDESDLPVSSWFMSFTSPPGGRRLGRLGGAPAFTITCEPGRVAICVWPLPVTVMLVPKMKFEIV